MPDNIICSVMLSSEKSKNLVAMLIMIIIIIINININHTKNLKNVD